MKRKNIILFVNAIRPATFDALRSYKRSTGKTLVPMVLVDKKIQASITRRNAQLPLTKKLTTIVADFDSATSIRRALKPYMDQILTVTSQYENSINELEKLIPYLPYLNLPTEQSLVWSTEKKLMRMMLEAYDPAIVPKYTEAADFSEETLDKIEGTLSYPMVVKPSGLEGSLLVSFVETRHQLREVLEHTFQEIQIAYDKWIKRQSPAILVEEFMDGDMYSLDTYVAHDGTCVHTPLVKVITGRNVGFDDFFAYTQSSPSGLAPTDCRDAQATAEAACRALGLRSVTAHVELMKTAQGWKVIEVGPRVGGYRHEIYSLTYGINHLANDVLNRAGQTPVVTNDHQSHTTIIKIHAREEGLFSSVDGLETIQNLPSFLSMKQNTFIGEVANFAKNNGDPIFEFLLNNPDPVQLAADIRSLEETIQVYVQSQQTTNSFVFSR